MNPKEAGLSGEQYFVGVWARLGRRILDRTIPPFLNSEFLNRERLAEAREFLQQGNGLLLLVEHKSKRETIDVGRIPFEDPEMIKRNLSIPVADHIRTWLVDLLARIGHIQTSYIYTDETKDRYQKAGKPITRREEAKRLAAYVDRTADNILHGGISIIFYQGGRRRTLYDGKNAKLLLYTIDNRVKKLAERTGIEEPNYGVACVSVNVDPENLKEENFERFKNRLNRKIKYTYNIGHTHSIKEYQTRAMDSSRNITGYRMDEVVYSEIELVTKPDYLGEGPIQKDADFQRAV